MSKNINNNHIPTLIVVVIFLLVFAVIVISGLRLEYKLTFDGIITLTGVIINVILTIFIAKTLQDLQDIKKHKKDILINRINSEINDIKEFVDECCGEGNVEYINVSMLTKTICIRIGKIEDIEEKCSDKIKGLIEGVRNLNGLLTDPVPGELEINDNTIFLKPKRIQDIKIITADIENKALELAISINDNI